MKTNTTTTTTTTNNEANNNKAAEARKPLTLAERLAKYEAKAAKTYNRTANAEAHRHNAFDRLADIAAAACLNDNNAAESDKAEALNYLYSQFIAAFNAKVKKGHAFEANFAAIKAAANTAEVMAASVTADGFKYAAAIRLAYSAIKAEAKAIKAEKWQNTLSERAAKAEAKAQRSAAFADKASRNAAVKAAKARKAAEAAKMNK